MKKIIAIVIVLALTLTLLCSCNVGLGMGNYSFKHIHIGGDNGYCATVETWYNDDRGIEVKTKEYGAIWCSEGTYILFETNICPFC